MEANQIAGILNAAYQQMPTDRVPWPLTGSTLGGCPRFLAHRLAGVQQTPLTPEARRLFELGHQRGARLHEMFADYMGSDAHCIDEYPVWIPVTSGQLAKDVYDKACLEFPEVSNDAHTPKPYFLSSNGIFCVLGHMDTLLIQDDEATIIDYKTASSYGFGKLDDEGPNDSYKIQLMAYAAGLSHERQLGIGPDFDNIRMFLVYEAKDADARKGHVGGSIKCVEVESDPNLYAKAILGAEDALRAWLDGAELMVPEPYPIGGKSGRSKKLPWQCDYCRIGPQFAGCYGTIENRSEDPLRPKWYQVDE